MSISTRPDIAYAIGNLAKFSSKPTNVHWMALKRVLRYLKGTVDFGIQYKKGASGECVGFSDADWAGDLDDRVEEPSPGGARVCCSLHCRSGVYMAQNAYC